MKKPEVDYRHFRLSRINDPQYSHLKLLLGWVGYFALYFITENLIPAENCRPMHCAIDDIIPFCEFFIIPYVFWYLLVVLSLGYFLLYNVRGFRQLQTYIIITQVAAMAAYIIFPTRQDLRPDEFVRDNIFTQVIAFLYSFDTSTGVCPSLHVAYSMGIMSVWLREKGASRLWRGFVVLAVVLICLSTMFIKQHSAVDVIAALPLCAVTEWLVFYGPVAKRLDAAEKVK